MPHKTYKVKNLSDLTDQELLDLRFKDIHFEIENTDIEKYKNRLYAELELKNLNFKPEIFIGDEWFSPEGMNAISVPFYLSHARLKNLENTLMLEVEGGTSEWFMKLLRHEAGHCFDHCFKFSKRKKWSKIFGSPNQDYNPDTYRPQPYSKSFVKHLDRWYAQAHPDEDFAETFAVWLNPDINWQNEYKNWPIALEKLNYIEQLANESLKLENLSVKGRKPSHVINLTSTLEKYYNKRRKENADDYPNFYDFDLKSIFNGDRILQKNSQSADSFMKKNRKLIVRTVSWATSEKKFTIDALVKRLILRCTELRLVIGKSELQTTMEVSSFLTSLVKNYLFTGKFKREA